MKAIDNTICKTNNELPVNGHNRNQRLFLHNAYETDYGLRYVAPPAHPWLATILAHNSFN